MKTIKIANDQTNWTKLVRYLRVNNEIIKMNEGDQIPYQSCYISNEHILIKNEHNSIDWTCYTVVKNSKNHNLEKFYSFSITLDYQYNFENGCLNSIGIGLQSLNKTDYKKIKTIYREAFKDKNFWDEVQILNHGNTTE